MLNLNAAFSALSDPTRRAILARLAAGESAGLIVRRAEATKRHCSLAPKPLEDLELWLSMLRRALEANYERLDKLLAAIPLDTQSKE